MITLTITTIIKEITIRIIMVIMLYKLMLLVTHYPGKFNSYLESISKGAFESIPTACIFAHFTWKFPFFLSYY